MNMLVNLGKGTSVSDFIPELLFALPDIELVEILEYPVLPGLQQRAARSPLASALHVHNEGGRRWHKIKARDVSAQSLEKLSNTVRAGSALGLVSRVILKGGIAAHIPMMDFHCDVSDIGRGQLVALLQEIMPVPGALFESGRSYHYYGAGTLNAEEWRIFMGRCLLLSSFVDARYVGHRLIEGFCVLRITRAVEKPSTPALVEAW